MLTVGHKREKEFLKKAFERGRVPSALLFSGPEGVGKKLLALEFARGLLCRSNEPFGCNNCKSCKVVNDFIEAVRKGETEDFEYRPSEGTKKDLAFLIGEHPDLALVVPDGKQIKIDQIREVKEFVLLKPSGKRKVVVVDEAEKMNPQAQNALLKILEEPPEYTVFVLITSSEGKLLPTVVSRCQRLEFKPLSSSEIEKILRNLNLTLSESTVKLIEKTGTLKILRAFSDDILSDFFELAEKIPLKKFSDIVRVAELFEKADMSVREILVDLLEDILFLKSSEGLISVSKLEMALNLLTELRNGLARGIKAKLAIENLMLMLKK